MNILKIHMRWIAFLLVIFISGCTLSDFNLGNFLKNPTSGEVGSGLIIGFDSNKPPVGRTLTEEDTFQVAVNLKNTGERSIFGELCVSDSFLYRSYGGIPEPECRLVNLGGADEGIEPSETKIYFPDNLNGYNYYNLDKYFSQTNTISATFTYDINTLSSTQICIKRDIDIGVPTGISCPDTETLSSNKIKNMPGPIIVSSIYKDVIPIGGNARIKTEITLKKITDGDILNLVSYRIGFAGGNLFDCGARSGELIFDKNEKIIKCNTNLNIGQDYINQPLVVELGYRFKKLISTQFELKGEDYNLKGQV